MLSIKPNYYSGTSGLLLPVANKTLYPIEFKDKSRLAYYASLFNSIEINSSFYKIPQPATVRKWAESVPQHFKFTFKLWREITHNKGLVFNPDDVARFIQAFNETGDNKGCLLVQFPPGIKSSQLPQLRVLLDCIRESDQQLKLAVEFRHASWYQESTAEVLSGYDAGIVLQDIPSSATPLSFADGKFVYLRLHGPGGKYKGTYTDEVLYEYSTYIKEWQDEGKTVFVYFNNTMGEALRNLNTLNNWLKTSAG
ncbi:DUF72 domain-containing protein [Mucilaginibacter polytrichastri]|uniref:DUF72 domain-containing protein n=1 Tax=Mucilaginibacter polytrichastri TaxID=1302689 RepID=A0A1Q5ZZ38_9SPHI|nr:DUF72 domain-containing protein [Mucilaginibacter polytrichastri]OKS87007.1 hypothetical protein RG47T_2465 [Mucilaginibacter polytrichastri]SFS85816.1 Uncharacterized conserved protein YecE, DUF72 family [Mucilaginibacter polytrichastri]